MVAEKSSSDVLRVGDVIGIADLQAGGFLVGEDVISSELFLDCFEGQLDTDVSPHNLQYAQFVVTPKYQYSTHSQIDDILSQAHSSTNDSASFETKIAHLERMRQQLPLGDHKLAEIEHLFCAYENEEKTNEMEFIRSLGQAVDYGGVIQLKHLRSGKFVSQARKRAKVDSQAMSLSLVAGGNKGSWFQVQAVNRKRVVGQHVNIGDQVYLSAVRFPYTFITVYDPDDKNVEPLAMPRCSIGSAPVMRQRLEVNASSRSYSLQPQLIRKWKTHEQWLEDEQHEDDVDEHELLVHGMDVLSFRQGGDRALYADPARETVWWLLTTDESVKEDEHALMANSLWRLKPVLVSLAGEPYTFAARTEAYLQHVASGKYLGENAQGRVILVGEPGGGMPGEQAGGDKHAVKWVLASPSSAERAALVEGDSIWVEVSSGMAGKKAKKGPRRWLGVNKSAGVKRRFVRSHGSTSKGGASLADTSKGGAALAERTKATGDAHGDSAAGAKLEARSGEMQGGKAAQPNLWHMLHVQTRKVSTADVEGWGGAGDGNGVPDGNTAEGKGSMAHDGDVSVHANDEAFQLEDGEVVLELTVMPSPKARTGHDSPLRDSAAQPARRGTSGHDSPCGHDSPVVMTAPGEEVAAHAAQKIDEVVAQSKPRSPRRSPCRSPPTCVGAVGGSKTVSPLIPTGYARSVPPLKPQRVPVLDRTVEEGGGIEGGSAQRLLLPVVIKTGTVRDETDRLEIENEPRQHADFLDSLLLCKVFLTELLEVIKSVEKTDVENSSFDDGRELTDGMWASFRADILPPTIMAKAEEKELRAVVGNVLVPFERCMDLLLTSCFKESRMRSGLRPASRHQNLIRHVGILKIASEIFSEIHERVQMSSSMLRRKMRGVHQVLQKSLQLLESTCRENLLNKRFVSKKLKLLEGSLTKDLEVYSTLLSIYQDCAELLGQMDFAVFREQIDFIKKYQRATLVALMDVTCSATNVPLPRNQNCWVKMILEGNPHLVWNLCLRQGNVWLIDPEGKRDAVSILDVYSKFHDGELMHPSSIDELQTLIHKGTDLTGDQSKAAVYRYYISIMHLLQSLVKGRNAKAATALQRIAFNKGLDFESLLSAMSAPNMPWSFRTRCCRLIRALYVDRDPFLSINISNPTCVWSGLHSGKSTGFHRLPSSGPSSNDVKSLKPVLVSMLKTCVPVHRLQNREQRSKVGSLTDFNGLFGSEAAEPLDSQSESMCSLIGKQSLAWAKFGKDRFFRDEFLVEIVETLSMLLDFGFFHKVDEQSVQVTFEVAQVREVLQALIELLDSRHQCLNSKPDDSDKHRENRSKKPSLSSVEKRYFQTMVPDKHIIDKRNVEILKLCTCFMDCVVSDGTAKVVQHFETIMREKVNCPDQNSALSKLQLELHDDEIQGNSQFMPDVTIEVLDATNDVTTPPKRWCSPNCNVWQKAGTGQANHGGNDHSSHPASHTLVDFVRDKTLWQRLPPWSKDDIQKIANDVIVSCTIPELRVETSSGSQALGLSGIVNDIVHDTWNDITTLSGSAASTTENLPRVVRILLDLIQRKDLELKTSALTFLIRIYRHTTALTQAIERIDLICDKSIALKYGILQDLVDEFHIQRRHISSFKDETSTGEEYTGQQKISDDALERITEIFLQWTAMLLESRTPRQFLLTQRLISQFHLHREAAAILLLSAESGCAAAGGRNSIASMRQMKLLNVIYAFLAALCKDDPKLQNGILHFLEGAVGGDNQGKGGEKHEEENLSILERHMQMDEIHPEPLIQTILSQNMKVSAMHGRDWARFILKIFNTSHLQSEKGAAYLHVVRALLICKDRPVKQHQDLVRSIIQSSDNLQALLVPDDALWSSDWYMGQISRSNRCVLETQAAFMLLLADLCRENVASNVFAERLVPFHWVVLTATRVAKVPLDMQLDAAAQVLAVHLQHSLLIFLRRVYLGQNQQDVSPDFSSPANGIWSSLEVDLHESAGITGNLALFPAFVSQLNGLCSVLSVWPRDFVKASCTCLTEAILPLLTDYYSLPNFLLPERALACNNAVTEDLCDALLAMTQHRTKLLIHMDPTEVSGLCNGAVFCINLIIEHGGVARAQVQYDDDNSQHTNPNLALRVSALVSNAFESFSSTLAKALHERECLQALPLLFATEGDASIYDDVAGPDKEAFKNPAMGMLLIEAISVLESDGGEEAMNLKASQLQTLRGALYLSLSDGSEADIQHRWDLFTRNASVIQTQESDRAQLSWVQNKFDIIGCTQVALRLSSHESSDIQIQALNMLLALLEGESDQVQNAIATYFRNRKRSDFFHKVHETIMSTKDSLKDLKRLLKPQKRHKISRKSVHLGKKSMDENSLDTLSKEQKGAERVICRESVVMLMLRVLQLMCSRQYLPLQAMMPNQASLAISHNLMRACTSLVSSVQPLANNLTGDKDPSSFLVLQAQLLSTLCDMIQGPNLVNQRELLESSVLFDINRMFSSMKYILYEIRNLNRDKSVRSMPESRSSMDSQEGTSDISSAHVNGLMGLLKREGLRLCLAFFDSVLDPEIPKRMLCFFDVSNFVSQMVNIAEVLGLDMEEKAQTHSFLSRNARNKEADRFDSLFPGGYRGKLRLEMLSYYHLLRYLKYYEAGEEVSKQLKTVKKSYPVLYTYLKTHTRSVEIMRAICLDAETGTMIQVKDKDDGKHAKHIEKAFFPVSEQMIALTNSRGFKKQWHALVWDLPHTKQDEKHNKFLQGVRLKLAMSTWLQLVASYRVGHFLMRKQEVLRLVQLRLTILITALLCIFYGLPVDPNTGYIVANGTWQMHTTVRTRPPSGYSLLPYPFKNQTSDPLGVGATYGSVLQNVDESLAFRMELTDRWNDPYGWKFFPQGKYILYVIGAVHVVLALLRLVAFLVIDFPLTYMDVDDEDDDEEEEVNIVLSKSELLGYRKRFYLALKEGLSSALKVGKKVLLQTICCVDLQSEQSEEEENEKGFTKRKHQKHHLHVHDHLSLKRIDSVKRKASKSKDLREISRKLLQDLPAAPKRIMLMEIFGKSGKLMQWKTIKRQLPAVYLMLLLMGSLLGIVSSPFYFVVCLMDHFRSNRAQGADVFQALYVGGPRLLRSFSFGFTFLIIVSFYAYTYFSQAAINEDETCHTLFQCVVKITLESLRGDVTSVIGTFGNWTFPPMAVWQELWFQYRTAFITITLIVYNFLLQPIMAGQIVDAFAQLRAENQTAKKELEHKCFITGLEKQSFNDYPGEWDSRKEGEYALRYLLFLKYLLEKDPADYTGLENDVMVSSVEGETDFFPLGAFFSQRMREREIEKAPEDATNSQLQKELKDLKEQHTATQNALEVLLELMHGRAGAGNTSLVREVFRAHAMRDRNNPTQGADSMV